MPSSSLVGVGGFTTFSGVGGWCGRMKNKVISAFNLGEVEVEAELGKMILNIYRGIKGKKEETSWG